MRFTQRNKRKMNLLTDLMRAKEIDPNRPRMKLRKRKKLLIRKSGRNERIGIREGKIKGMVLIDRLVYVEMLILLSLEGRELKTMRKDRN